MLRRYRIDIDATAEAEIMRYVHRHGYPVPVVHRAAGRDLEMERLDGPTLAEAMVRGEPSPQTGADVLADLHRRLHEVPLPHGSAPSDRIVHLDLHPSNVLLARRGPVLVDWTNATHGSPDLDLAVTAVILGEVAVAPGHPRAIVAREVLMHFLRLARGSPLRALDQAVARRRADPGLSPAEKDRLPEVAALVRAEHP